MKRLYILIGVLLVAAMAASAALFQFLNRSDPSEGKAPALAGAPAGADVLVRGEYLAKAADCIACHTVVGKGRPFAGGLAFELPFGRLYSTNITADAETGIGRWTDDEFVRAMHDGVRRDGKLLYPAFPYTSYTQLSRGDVLAIKAYLFSLPPVKELDREPELGFPFNQRWAMGFWNAVFFKKQRFVADTSQSPQWNRGAYLALPLAHCAECHTPRNLGFALKTGKDLAGETLQGWRAWNLTADPDAGVGAWSDEDLAQYMGTGHAAGRGSAGGPMGEVVEHSLQYLEPDDMAALVAYLRSVPSMRGDSPVTVDAAPRWASASTAEAPASGATPGHEQGARLFAAACASCHQWNGQGRQTPHASLLGLRSVNDPGGSNVVQMIVHGVDMHVRDAAIYMPPYDAAYSDTEMASLANYVIAQFGAKQGQVTSEMVARQRKP